MTTEKREELIKKAALARENAYAPYSNFKVGAAILTTAGDIYTGCNIENSAYSVSNCAERTAIFKAVSEGQREIEAVAVVVDEESPATPCGSCRQVISEFGTNIEVIMANLNGDIIIKDIQDLLWGAFKLND
ncbi:MAG: cytidine deaminase [Bacillota bacterium]